MQQQRKESSYCTYASISVSSCRRLTTRRHDGNNPLLTHAQQALAAPPAPECTHMHALPALLLGATACTSYQLPSPALVSPPQGCAANTNDTCERYLLVGLLCVSYGPI